MVGPIPEGMLDLNGFVYPMLERSPGVRRWDVKQVATQPGDGGTPKSYPLEFHGGFGASRRFLNGLGKPNEPTHHAYSLNWQSHVEGLGAASPRITYLDLSSGAKPSGGFRLGGSLSGRLGGSSASLGGGSFSGTIATIAEFGSYLYCSGGARTFVIDPAASTPNLVETKQYAAGARCFSSDVWDNILCFALGSNVDAVVATSPYTTTNGTTYAAASGIQMSVFRKGTGGRLFAGRNNLVFNVLPGADPSVSANYLPPAGEVITDTTDPVRGLVEWGGGLVASTQRTLRTFDPNAGFISRPLLPENRVSVSDYDGRAQQTLGNYLFYANARAVWALYASHGFSIRLPEHIGPELLQSNQTPFIGGSPGVPDFAGDAVYWPFYFATTGDSVIFRLEPRSVGTPGDVGGQVKPGTGGYIWSEFLYLQGRECRAVKYWGGTSSVKPRLFFGAGTSATPEQIGWVPLGRTVPDIFDSGSIPALSATIYSAIDDFGAPGVVREVERLEFPSILNADASNYLVASVSDDEGTTFKDLVTTNTGAANDNRITGTGFQQVYADVATPSIPAGRWLQVRFVITQASGATSHFQYRGVPQLYVLERAGNTDQYTTELRIGPKWTEDTDVMLARLRALEGGAKVALKNQPGDAGNVYVQVQSITEKEVEILDADGNLADRVIAVEAVLRKIPTGL